MPLGTGRRVEVLIYHTLERRQFVGFRVALETTAYKTVGLPGDVSKVPCADRHQVRLRQQLAFHIDVADRRRVLVENVFHAARAALQTVFAAPLLLSRALRLVVAWVRVASEESNAPSPGSLVKGGSVRYNCCLYL